MTNVSQPILLIGYTARMMAELAVRAGYSVTALDYFGDSDLQALCPSQSLLRDFGGKSYNPQALVEAARMISAPTVVYSASFENHPALVAQLAENGQLFGNSPDVLERVRDPFQLASALREGGFKFPETLHADANPDSSRHWLWKPLRGGGGSGIRTVGPHPNPFPKGEEVRGMFQERLDGMIGSVAFVANGQRAVLIGLTEQLVGRRSFGASGFRWCGNLLPARLSRVELAAAMREAQALVNHVTAAFGLRGMNGLDFIWHDGRIWTLEVNPRPSASLELMDAAYNLRVFDAHVRSFFGELPAFSLEQALTSGTAMGKAVLFTRQDLMVGDTSDWWQRDIRDIPHPNEHIARGHPVCTLLATGATPDACLRRLRAKAKEVRSWLMPS
jgi:hypothetical protein